MSLGVSSPSEPSSPAVDDVPLLSQDEFFRHLELQSVHSVKFTYRQALKERLRATTKKSSLNLPPSRTSPPPNKVRRTSTSGPSSRHGDPTASSSPKWLSPKSCRRLFSRPKIKRDKIEHKRLLLVSASRCDSIVSSSSLATPDRFPNATSTLASSSILGPLINNCHLYRHPKVSEEIEQFSLEKRLQRKVTPEQDENQNCSRQLSHIIQRIDFDKSNGLSPPELKRPRTENFARQKRNSPVSRNSDLFPNDDNLVESRHGSPDDKEYEARIRIQPEVKTEDLDNASPLLRFLPRSKPPPPPSYLIQPRKLSQIPISSSAISSSSSSVSSSCTSSSSDASSKSNSTQLISTPKSLNTSAVKLLSHKCRHCSKMFSSRNALAYHEENGHTTCRMCRKTFKSKWKKSKAMHICQDCVRRFPNSKKEDHMPLLPLIGLIQKQVLKKSKISSEIKCDICPKSFSKRSHMIKHVLASHASEMHRVNLEKFQSCLSEQHLIMGGADTKATS